VTVHGGACILRREEGEGGELGSVVEEWGVLMRVREELEADVEDDVIAREGVDLVMSQTPIGRDVGLPTTRSHKLNCPSCSVES
jgi:hypothetical protein